MTKKTTKKVATKPVVADEEVKKEASGEKVAAKPPVEKKPDWRAGLVVGKQVMPPRICIYGTHGIGKSTIAAMFPNPIFISTEDGIGNIDTVSFPQADIVDQVVSNIRTLILEEHDFQTVVIDTVDWLVSPLIETDIEDSHEASELSYGKGAMLVSEAFREVLQGLNLCRTKRNMNVVLLAHSNIVRFDSPTSEPFDRYEPKLPKRCNALLEEWVDVLAFASFKVVVKKTDVGFNKEVARGISTGDRLLHYIETAAYVAKNRYDCPSTSKMTIEQMAKHIPIVGVE